MPVKYQIFVSYRRDGGEALAQLMADRLRGKGFVVFHDVESLRSGAFNEDLLNKIAECEDVLVILPPNGLDRCISDPDDWVLREISHALKLGKNVIPIMMRNFEFPAGLPEDIAILPNLNGITANNYEYFDAVIERLVNLFLYSKPIKNDDDGYLIERGENGDAQAWNLLGLRYEYGSESHVVNTRIARQYYQKAAEAGDPGGMYNLAAIYDLCSDDLTMIDEYDVEDDLEYSDPSDLMHQLREKAAAYYKKLSEESFAPAIFRLGNLAEEQNELKEAQEYYEQAAKLNYPPAENALGYLYYMGSSSVHPDMKKAFRCFKKAADEGYAPAVYNYANMLEADNEWDEAIKQYQRIAFGVNCIPQAAYALGRLYETKEHDMIKAVNYYRTAQREGIPDTEKDVIRCLEKRSSEKSQADERNGDLEKA